MDQPKIYWKVQTTALHADGAKVREFRYETWAEVEEVVENCRRFQHICVTAASDSLVVCADTWVNHQRAMWLGVMSGPCSDDPVWGERAGAEE